ncbi:hypothetical protein [Cronobacter dublinensis]|uniref:hypothetical protein n=1 Tax=Cronobacter dublinensis TaxID=413497 RepID=UPI000CFB85CE|nr:hypothetical protein [Cronobacter dublinensis]EKF2277828.1 hypothetical protein [Cronobacter dublinensis]EKF2291602.1 hypothetical protein [Cronobacter dublinensis]EKF2297232.1 hypothetical protein [Cronobacter dublinensis]EKK5269348.1 hypothetical protein [Cronobacter dublinensis]EKM0137851.1 hypothetical protein [Cronobacter dublinensis]
MNIDIFSTVITGVTIFVSGQIVLKGFIEPFLNFKEHLGKISLLFLSKEKDIADVKYNEELVNLLKESAAHLAAKQKTIPAYWLVGKITNLPSEKEILESAVSISYIADLIERNKPAESVVNKFNYAGYYYLEIIKNREEIQRKLNILLSYEAVVHH